MPMYITLYKWTEQGIKNVKSAPDRAAAAMKAAEAAGIKVVGLYVTQGEYDLVAISEAADEQAAVALLLAQGAQGYVRTTTMRAFTMAEFAEIVKKIP
ncbi:MAG: GYD domain-containing protein [Acidobacteria bacterium]|nr:GYD domain-containing protein [Acidobacteriota bacterium]